MNYFWLTIKHKWFVLLAGLKTKAPLWRLLIHDWSKFTPAEYFGYQWHFFPRHPKVREQVNVLTTEGWGGRGRVIGTRWGFGGRRSTHYITPLDGHQAEPYWAWKHEISFPDKHPDGFPAAWLHHQNSNPHHWEYWIERPGGEALPMPEWAVREMIADWMGAGRSYQGKWDYKGDWPWFKEHFPKMILHPKTRQRVLDLVTELKEQS